MELYHFFVAITLAWGLLNLLIMFKFVSGHYRNIHFFNDAEDSWFFRIFVIAVRLSTFFCWTFQLWYWFINTNIHYF